MSKAPPAYTITHDCVSVVINGDTLTVRRGALNFDAARKAVLEEKWENIEKVFAPGHAVEKWLGKGFVFQGGRISYAGEVIPPELSGRMVQMAEAGKSPAPLMNFWRRLQNNPSMRSVDQLFGFLSNKGIPLDQEGYILAYKAVRQDWKDFHTGTIVNSVGSKHSMPRNKISDDPKEACHYGFHVGALEYARTFGNSDRRILICKVDPANVVCVPYDHSQMKVRVCEYEVIAEHGKTEHLSDIFEDSAKLKSASPATAPATPNTEDDLDDDLDDDLEDDLDEQEASIASEDSEGTEVKAAPLTPESMQKIRLEDLRKYAKGIGMKNPGKILGGKPALSEAILAFQKTLR